MIRSGKKHEEVIKVARELFWKHGFKRISVEEVCQKAGVSKMTFYRFYPNKLELAKAVFDVEVQKGMQAFRTIMEEDTPPSEKMRKMLQMKFEGANNISREFLMDFYSSTDTALKTFVEEKTAQAWGELLNDFRQAQQKGIFRSDFKPEFMLYLSQKIGDLINDTTLLQLYNSPQELIMEFANFFSYGISPHD